MKVVFLPGNGGGSPKDNWFPSVQAALESRGIEVLNKEFPDTELARAKFWLPFLEAELHCDENTILVGHSSGAIAAMKYAENHKILGSVLVGTYHTDLDMDTEKKSGYFDTPWQWDQIRANQQWSIVFASTNDPWIPIAEARFVKDQLVSEYHEYHDQGHFGGDYLKEEFFELAQAIFRKLGKLISTSQDSVDHVAVVIPKGSEEVAREYYGSVLGFRELPKPKSLQKNGGLWFQHSNTQVHFSIENRAGIDPNDTRAHVAYRVSSLDEITQKLKTTGYLVEEKQDLVEGIRRAVTRDPFGNEVEFIERIR